MRDADAIARHEVGRQIVVHLVAGRDRRVAVHRHAPTVPPRTAARITLLRVAGPGHARQSESGSPGGFGVAIHYPKLPSSPTRWHYKRLLWRAGFAAGKKQ